MWWERVGVFAFDEVDLFSYIEVDITPVVAILIGLGLRLLWPVPGLSLTDPPPGAAGVSVPPVDIALGDRPTILLQMGIKPD